MSMSAESTLAPWEVLGWQEIISGTAKVSIAALVAGIVVASGPIGAAVGAAGYAGYILGLWLGSYAAYKLKYKQPGLPEVNDIASLMRQIAPKLTETEAVNVLAYLSRQPSNFDYYYSAWTKLSPGERDLIRSWIYRVAETIPQVSVEWQKQLIKAYCDARPGGCGNTPSVAMKQSEEKAKSQKECADWDITCKLEKSGKKLLGLLAVVGVGVIGIYLLKK